MTPLLVDKVKDEDGVVEGSSYPNVGEGALGTSSSVNILKAASSL